MGAFKLPALLTSTDSSVKDMHFARKFSSWSGHVPTTETKQLTELQWTSRKYLNFFSLKPFSPCKWMECVGLTTNGKKLQSKMRASHSHKSVPQHLACPEGCSGGILFACSCMRNLLRSVHVTGTSSVCSSVGSLRGWANTSGAVSYAVLLSQSPSCQHSLNVHTGEC